MTWHALVDPAFSGRLCLTLLHSVWQVALLVLIAWCVDRLWRGRSVERRYALNVAALVATFAAMPITYMLLDVAEKPAEVAVEAPLPATAVESRPTPVKTSPVEAPSAAVAETPAIAPQPGIDDHALAPAASVSSSVAPSPIEPSPVEPSPRWLLLAPWLVALYTAGVVLMLARLTVGIVRSYRLGAEAELLTAGPVVEALRSLAGKWSMRVVPALARAERIAVPKVVGLARPMILLPASAISGLSIEELEMILAHELAHVRRYDTWVNLGQRLAEAVLFFNPALWYLSRRISALREYCCDEMTCGSQSASASEPRVRYATALLRVVELAKPNAATTSDLASLAAGRSPSEIRRRVARLFGEPLREPLRVSRGGVLTLVLLGVSLAVGLPVWNTRAESETVTEAEGDDKPLEAADQANKSGVSVSAFGKVVDSEGNPVASATVYLREWGSQLSGANIYERSPRDVLASTQTDARGTFRFEGVTAPPLRYAFDDPWDVVVVAEGYGMAWRHLRKAEDETPITLTLHDEATLTGRLVDKDGQPIADAEVSVAEFAGLGSRVRDSGGSPDRITLWRSQLAIRVQTDADGRLSIGGLPRETRVELIGKHDRHARKIFYAATTDRPQPELKDVSSYRDERHETVHKVHTGDFTVPFEPGYQIRGRVVFADTKQPCPDAKVNLSWESRAHYAMADSEGRFAFRSLSLSPPQWRVRASTSEKDDYLGRGIRVPLHKDKPDVDVILELPRGELVTGSVAGEDGEPIPGARVYFRDELPKDAPDRVLATGQTTDEDGAFRIAVPPGKGSLVISGPVDDYDLPDRRYGQEPDPRFVQSIEVKRGEPIRDVRFTIGRGLVINGRIADPEGKPVADAEIKTVRFHFRDGRFKEATTNSDADGRFTLSGFPPADAVAMEVRHPQRKLFGKATVEADERAGVARVASVDVKLQRAATVKGRVLVDGQPVADVRVDLHQYRTHEGKRYGIGVDHTETDDSGRFSFDLTPPGEGFYLSRYSKELTELHSRSFDLEPGQTHELPTFELQSKGMSVAGIVVDPDGNPVEGVAVSVSKRAGGSIGGAFTRQPTGKDGRFVVKGVPNVPLNIMAYIRAPDDAPDRTIHFPARVDAEPGETNVRILLDPTLVRGVR